MSGMTWGKLLAETAAVISLGVLVGFLLGFVLF